MQYEVCMITLVPHVKLFIKVKWIIVNILVGTDNNIGENLKRYAFYPPHKFISVIGGKIKNDFFYR